MTMTLETLKARWGGHIPGLMGARHNYAVLCPLLEKGGELHLLFEVRAKSLHSQPGEVCFPGGRREPGEDAVRCALRETEEELAIPARSVEVLGLTDFIHNQAGFILQPVLGRIDPAALSLLRPSPDEVAEVFTVPLSFFQTHTPAVYSYELTPEVPADFPYEDVGIPETYSWRSGQVVVPVWNFEGHAIWGMTARIVRSLVEETK